MSKNSLFILLGIVECILLTLIGLYFYRMEKQEERVVGQLISSSSETQGALRLSGPQSSRDFPNGVY